MWRVNPPGCKLVYLWGCPTATACTVAPVIVAAEYPKSTLKSTATCSSCSDTALYEACVAGHRNLDVYMWHDQGEWVTCRQFSILSFQYKSLKNLKCYILIQIPSQSNIWFRRYEQFFNFKNNVKHKNLSPLLACNSKSIFSTSDSSRLIMSHICYHHLVMYSRKCASQKRVDYFQYYLFWCLWLVMMHSDVIARHLPMLVFHNNFARCEYLCTPYT